MNLTMNSRRVALGIACSAFVFGIFSALGLSVGERVRDAPSTALSEKSIAADGGDIGRKLRRWYSKGTAAGNIGDYYDNRDGGHSELDMKPYPQLQKIEYTDEQIKARQDWGLQKKVLPFVVFGNSSTSSAPEQGGSNARHYYVDPGGLEFLFTQYTRNNLYIYPEHRDYDPGDFGVGGYGDLFPTNTPCLIASQGSSGSDQPFMRAIPYVLAAFRPEVKKKLIQTGLLMPAIQMILRITNRQISTRNGYLTGKAHPSVFRGSDLDVGKMVEMAHEITLSTIPPMALLKVVEETATANGIDYFEPGQTEILANTPAVIARIFRGSDRIRKITVSARDSVDLNKRPLKFYWAVLRGDPDRIRIRYLNQDHSIAEITVPYFRRAPIAEGSALESNRVDIGIFVNNGAYYSPPAFVTFYTLDSEARTYRADGKPLEIAYDVKTSTITVADWKRFFDALNQRTGSWTCNFLRSQFKSGEITALTNISGDFGKIHAALLDARRKQEEANKAAEAAGGAIETLEKESSAVRKSYEAEQDEEAGNSLARLTQELNELQKAYKNATSTAREALRTVNTARKSEKELLEQKMPDLNLGASALVQEVLNKKIQDPNLWTPYANELELLYKAAGEEPRTVYDTMKKALIQFGVGTNSGGMLPRLTSIGDFNNASNPRLTRYEKAVVANLNAIMLSRIVLPGILDSEMREHLVDFRISSAKGWRDVYRYAPDGTPMGWRRYQPAGIMEFNADGLTVLEKDAQGRCVRGRLVRYELEPQRKDSQGRPAQPFRRKVKMVPTDMIREYGYDGETDWLGHINRRYIGQ